MTTRGKALKVTAATVAVTALLGVGFVPPPKHACAAQAKMSFAEDVLPVFKGR